MEEKVTTELPLEELLSYPSTSQRPHLLWQFDWRHWSYLWTEHQYHPDWEAFYSLPNWKETTFKPLLVALESNKKISALWYPIIFLPFFQIKTNLHFLPNCVKGKRECLQTKKKWNQGSKRWQVARYVHPWSLLQNSK